MLAIQAEEGKGSGHPSEPQLPSSTTQPTHEEPIPNVVSSSHQKTPTPMQALNKVVVPGAKKPWGGSITQTRFERVPTPPYDSPFLRVHTLGSDEGSMTLQELMVLCITLSKKVESLEADLKQTKKVYGATYTKLIMKVKRGFFQTGRMIEEMDQDAGVTLLNKMFTLILEEEGQLVLAVVELVLLVGKGKMEESEDEQSKRTKLQQEQDRLGHEAAVRLHEELDEEERQRMARVHELKELFETTMKNVNTFVPMETEDRGRASELASGSSQATIIDSAEVGSSKRDAEAELDHEGSKRQKTNETLGSVQEQREEEEKEMSQ
ncbi:hypothetical protein Tco_0213987 [Tanacetum coccineum]